MLQYTIIDNIAFSKNSSIVFALQINHSIGNQED